MARFLLGHAGRGLVVDVFSTHELGAFRCGGLISWWVKPSTQVVFGLVEDRRGDDRPVEPEA